MKKITGFRMEETLVTKDQWDAVGLWAAEHGYTDLAIGKNAGSQPVGNVTWFDALKFCNAASELAGLEPAYLLPDGSVYRTGICDAPAVRPKSDKSGYRLPTSAEWEVACRAGTTTEYYWGDSLDPEYVWFTHGGSKDLTVHPVGQLKPNGYGLYDMSGNACEWCIDARGPFRVLRGGSVGLDSKVTSSFEAVVGPNYVCYETSLRPVTDNPAAPDLRELEKRSGFCGQHREYKLAYPPMDDRSVAERLDYALGTTEGAEKVHALVREGKYTEALEAYRDGCLSVMFEKKTGKKPAASFTLAEAAGDEKDPNEFEGYNWFPGGDNLSYPLPGKAAADYVEKRTETARQRLLCELYSNVVCRKAQFDALSDEMLNAWQGIPVAWYGNMGFHATSQGDTIVSAMQTLWAAGALATIPAAYVAQSGLYLMNDLLYTGVKDCRLNVPNQKTKVLRKVYWLNSYHPDFRLYEPVKAYVTELLCGHFERAIYPDGTGMEQAFNYNGNIIFDYLDTSANFPEVPIQESAKKRVSYLSRMLDVCFPPVSDYPAVGTCGFITPPDVRDPAVRQKYLRGLLHAHVRYDALIFCPDPKDSDIKPLDLPYRWPDNERILRCTQGDMSDPPRFTSVFFPYNGQAVLRDGFAWDSTYLFFFAPRKGSGHAVENVNDIFFIAYGRPFLVNAGGGSYGVMDWIPEDQRPYIGKIDEYQHSSYGRNVVLVDGTSQSRLRLGDSCVFDQYPSTTGCRFHDGERMLYVEGTYADGYYADAGVHHRREIFYHKKSGVFFILDSLTADKPHTYTQNWNIMPHVKQISETDIKLPGTDMTWGFENDEVIVDEAQNRIFTAQKDAPNLFLYQFSAHPLRYSRDYGNLDPARGWFSASLPGRRYPKPDIHTHWDAPAGTSTVLTVMAAAPTETSRIASIVPFEDGAVRGCDLVTDDGTALSFRFADTDAGMTLAGGSAQARAALIESGDGIVMSGAKDYVLHDGKPVGEVRAPIGFDWEEKDGYCYPVYKY